MSIAREYLTVSGLEVDVVYKEIENMHISVYPPFGRVRVAAPSSTPEEVIRLAIVQRITWIKEQREKYFNTSRQSPRRMQSGESHFVWGDRYILDASMSGSRSSVFIKGRTLFVISTVANDDSKKLDILERWYRSSLKAAIEPLLETWQEKIGVRVSRLSIRRMKTKWGTCVPDQGTIWINSELAKKNPRCLEYIVVHELVHLREARHSELFVKLMDTHLPDWRVRRDELNEATLSAEKWNR